MTDYKQMFEGYINQQEFSGSLASAFNYVMRNSGGRIRPQLTLAWCEACGGQPEKALPFALAVECVHTMSLIHDDLPCMDDETTRRGKPCLHLQMGEDTAILCGDKLLALSFYIISNADMTANQIQSAVQCLSDAACNMADGQHRELRDNITNATDWLDIHKNKTATLLSAACMLGSIAADGCESDLLKAASYGHNLGIGYQLLDDLQDHDGITGVVDPEDLGYHLQKCIASCHFEKDTYPYTFLTEFARRILK